jgi:hypothetical protein
VRVTVNGTVVEVAAEELAPLLELDPSELHLRMCDGAVTSLYEIGQDEDAGRFRVTFRSANWRVRLTCASDGTGLKRLRNRRSC